MIKRFFIIAVLFITILACQSDGRIYNEHKELSPRLEWLKKDTRQFLVPIDDTSSTYNFSLSFRFTSGYEYKIAKVKVSEMSPGGRITEKVYDLKVRDEKGDYIGEFAYEIWDSEHLVEQNKTYNETGSYTYVIEHIMDVDPLSNVMEIGVILDKAE